MAVRGSATAWTYNVLIAQMMQDKNQQLSRKAMAALLSKSPRELYESCDFLTQMNRQPVDALVRFTLRRAQSEAPIRDLLTDALIDGFRLWRDRTVELPGKDDEVGLTGEYIPEDIHIIDCAHFINDELRQVQIRYDFYPDDSAIPPGPPGYSPRTDALSKAKEWTYWAQYDKNTKGATLTEMRYPKGQPDSSDVIRNTTPLDQFPYIGVQSIGKCSLLEHLKLAILRYETVIRQIGGENDRHSRRVKSYSGAAGASKSQEQLIEEGREYLPPNVKAEYADTHPEGIEPMFRELAVIEDEIRNGVGAQRLMKLHNTSGPSREIEIIPMESQANALRDLCRKIMEVAYPGKSLHFGPLIDLNPQEMDITVNTLRECAWEETVTMDEYRARIRLLLDFPDEPQQTPQGPTKVALLPPASADRKAVATAPGQLIPAKSRASSYTPRGASA